MSPPGDDPGATDRPRRLRIAAAAALFALAGIRIGLAAWRCTDPFEDFCFCRSDETGIGFATARFTDAAARFVDPALGAAVLLLRSPRVAAAAAVWTGVCAWASFLVAIDDEVHWAFRVPHGCSDAWCPPGDPWIRPAAAGAVTVVLLLAARATPRRT